MDNQLLFNDSKIRHAWQLFINKGILKREALRNEIVYGWERARFLNLNPHKGIVALDDTHSVSEGPSLNTEMIEQLEHYNWSCIIVDEQHNIIDDFILHKSIINLKKGRSLSRAKTGNLSIYLTLADQKNSYVLGAEHYLFELHDLVDMSFRFEYRKQSYYISFFTLLSNYGGTSDQQFSATLEQWCAIWQADKLAGDVPGLIQLSISFDGKIIRSSDEKLNDLSGQSALRIFKQASLEAFQQNKLYQNVQSKVRFAVVNKEISSDEILLSMMKIDDDQAVTQAAPLKNQDNQAKLYQPEMLLGNDRHAIYQHIDHFKNSLQGKVYYSIINAYLSESKQLDELLTSKQSAQSQIIVISGLELITKQAFKDLMDKIETCKAHLISGHKKLFLLFFREDSKTHFAKQCSSHLALHRFHEMAATKQLNSSASSAVQDRAQRVKLATLAEVERAHIADILRYCRGNISKAAKILGIGRSTLYRKLDKHAIEIDRYK